MSISIPEPISMGVMLTYKCTASCRHCMYACSPEWTSDWIKEEELEFMLEKLAPYIKASPYGSQHLSLNYGLHFTGGEPFLNFELLCRAVEIAESLGIPSTFVETNCFWAQNDRTTRNKLKALKERGLKGIMISVNPFYLEFVPFRYTKRAVQLAREVFGSGLMVYQQGYFRRFHRLGYEDTVPFEEYVISDKSKVSITNLEFFLMGRAPYQVPEVLGSFFRRQPADEFLDQSCHPSFLRPWHNHYDNYGNLVPGYCGGLSLGQGLDINQILNRTINREERPVLYYLAREDLRGLLDLALQYGFSESNQGYYSRCHLCLELRRFLQRQEDFEELVPTEFYQRL